MSRETARVVFLAVFGTIYIGQMLRAHEQEKDGRPLQAVFTALCAMLIAYVCIAVARA